MSDLDGIDFGDLPDRYREIESTYDSDDDVPITPEYDGFCTHSRTAINPGMRRLSCRDCDAALDPFDFLLKLTNDMNRWIVLRRSAEKRARQAEARVNEILRVERNARARLKRLKGGS